MKPDPPVRSSDFRSSLEGLKTEVDVTSRALRFYELEATGEIVMCTLRKGVGIERDRAIRRDLRRTRNRLVWLRKQIAEVEQ